MASYKITIKKEFGTFKAKFWETGPGVPEPKEWNEEGIRTIQDVVTYLRGQFDEADLDEEDDVIWRGIAYTNLGELEREMRRANY